MYSDLHTVVYYLVRRESLLRDGKVAQWIYYGLWREVWYCCALFSTPHIPASDMAYAEANVRKTDMKHWTLRIPLQSREIILRNWQTKPRWNVRYFRLCWWASVQRRWDFDLIHIQASSANIQFRNQTLAEGMTRAASCTSHSVEIAIPATRSGTRNSAWTAQTVSTTIAWWHVDWMEVSKLETTVPAPEASAPSPIRTFLGYRSPVIDGQEIALKEMNSRNSFHPSCHPCSRQQPNVMPRMDHSNYLSIRPLTASDSRIKSEGGLFGSSVCAQMLPPCLVMIIWPTLNQSQVRQGGWSSRRRKGNQRNHRGWGLFRLSARHPFSVFSLRADRFSWTGSFEYSSRRFTFNFWTIQSIYSSG